MTTNAIILCDSFAGIALAGAAFAAAAHRLAGGDSSRPPRLASVDADDVSS